MSEFYDFFCHSHLANHCSCEANLAFPLTACWNLANGDQVAPGLCNHGKSMLAVPSDIALTIYKIKMADMIWEKRGGFPW